MKTWSKPELMNLNVRFTNEGGLGGASDLQHYDIYGKDVIGTSGTSIEGEPGVTKK